MEVTFTLPDMIMAITIRASVCWIRQDRSLIGLRFEPADEARQNVKRWIDNYLEIG